MWPQTAEQRRARRRANRLGHIGAFEDDRLGSQFVQGRGVNLCSSIAGHGIGSLLIRKKNEQVRLAHRFFRLIKHSSSGSLASNSSSNCSSASAYGRSGTRSNSGRISPSNRPTGGSSNIPPRSSLARTQSTKVLKKTTLAVLRNFENRTVRRNQVIAQVIPEDTQDVAWV